MLTIRLIYIYKLYNKYLNTKSIIHNKKDNTYKYFQSLNLRYKMHKLPLYHYSFMLNVIKTDINHRQHKF